MSTRANREPLFRIEENIYFPIETYGRCANNKCNKNAYLADGFCMECWDTKVDTRTPKIKKV